MVVIATRKQAHRGGTDRPGRENKMKYELVVVWTTGETSVYECKNLEDAKRAQRNMVMAFGNQIQYCEPRKARW